MTGLRDSGQRIQAAREHFGKELVILGHHYQRDEVIQLRGFPRRFAQAGARCRRLPGREVHHLLRRAFHGGDGGHPGRARARRCFSRNRRRFARSRKKPTAPGGGCLGAARGPDGCGTRGDADHLCEFRSRPQGFLRRAWRAVCTSSNARAVLNGLCAPRRSAFFFPDQHLGAEHGHAASGSPRSGCRCGIRACRWAGRPLRNGCGGDRPLEGLVLCAPAIPAGAGPRVAGARARHAGRGCIWSARGKWWTLRTRPDRRRTSSGWWKRPRPAHGGRWAPRATW